MAYTHTTFAQAKAQLAAWLHDPNNVHWSDAELGNYITETLRTWGVFANYWKERGAFDTAASTPFYDLSTELPSLRAQTLTDSSLVTTIQYQLLEPATGVSWTGTEMFTLADVTNALQRRRNQFLVETGMVLSHGTQAVGAPADGRFLTADTVIDIRHLAWVDADGYYRVLSREDEWGMQSYNFNWVQEPGTPGAYSVSTGPPLSVQLYPAPADVGSVDLLTISSGAALDPASGIAMGLPNDWVWLCKWGALADLLAKDGQARDPQRAQYCQQRWNEGLQLAKASTSVLAARINNKSVPVVSLEEIDNYDASLWMNHTGIPSKMGMAGQNIVAFWKVPDGVYGISVDVLRNAPVPVADGDFLEVGREELEAIIAYAAHLAAFKMGGQEFFMTMPEYARFLNLAMVRNERLKAAAINWESLRDRVPRQEEMNPRREELVEK